MQLHFHVRPWDLYAAIGYTAAISTLLLFLDVGNLFAILLVLFLPGYVIVALLFPASGEIDWAERIVLSFSVSIALVSLLGLLLNFTTWGIRFAPIVVSILLFTVIVGCVAFWRRMRLPPERRLSATVVIAMPAWQDDRRLDKILIVALAASMVLAASTLVYVILTPLTSERFTEFYILGPGGTATAYPTRLNVSQPGDLILGIVNHESATVDYGIRVELIGMQLIYNYTNGHNETVEVNRTTQSWINVTRADGQNWTQPYTFSIASIGLWKLQFLLYKNHVLTNQELHLFIRVF